jgi:hypothetical protein
MLVGITNGKARLMKRQKRSANPRKKHPKTQSAQNPVEPSKQDQKKSRRNFLATVSNFGLLAVVGGAAGWYFVDAVRATTRELDLTRIGNGVPTVVQIHDPNCSICAALQKEARDAMSDFDDNELQFVVANIAQDKGRALANKHGVQHITLLLLDGKGNRRGVLVGPNKSDYLKDAFRDHVSLVSRK